MEKSIIKCKARRFGHNELFLDFYNKTINTDNLDIIIDNKLGILLKKK